jgi:N-acetylmuramoyl-L-alanine amidase
MNQEFPSDAPQVPRPVGRHTTLRLAAVPAAEAPPLDRGTRFIAVLAVLALVGVLVWVVTRPQVPSQEPLSWIAIAPPQNTAIHPWRYIVLHHSASRGGNAQVIDRDHVNQNGWDGIGYHFVLGNGVDMPLGRIEATFRWRSQSHGAHAGALPAQKPFNTEGIGICLIGNYETQALDPFMEHRLVELCAQLIDRIPTLSVGRILGHRDVPGKSTACPGRGVDLERIRFLVRQEMLARGLTVR